MTRTRGPERWSPGTRAALACLLEASAPKPGNVHPGAAFADVDYLDFALSATVLAGPLDRARTEGVGAAVLAAVEATREVVSTNTNLGMILLLAPLAAVPPNVPWRVGVGRVLASTTIDDARLVYRAIRLAQPGGLGDVEDQDVAEEPTITLTEAMRLAASRDGVARQYATNYRDIAHMVLPSLRRSHTAGLAWDEAIVTAFLETLAACPDTLIARKQGLTLAEEASRRALSVLKSGDPKSNAHRAAIADFDTWLRADGHARNPGTTADLIAAGLFLALGDGTMPLPRRPRGVSIPNVPFA